jgi:hypothetical protein
MMGLLKLAVFLLPLLGGALIGVTDHDERASHDLDALPNRQPDAGLPRLPDMSVHVERAAGSSVNH